jgi:hypothetical protein
MRVRAVVGVVWTCVLLLLGAAGPAFASAGMGAPKVSAPLPASVFVSSRVAVIGRVSEGSGIRVVLQQRGGRGWHDLALAKPVKSGAFSLTWRTPTRTGQAVVRVAVLKGSRVITSTGSERVAVGPRPLVVPTSEVISVPAPGQPGAVVLHARLPTAHTSTAAAAASCPTLSAPPHVGQILALGYSASTPYGSLTKIDFVNVQAPCELAFQTVPATLEEAVGSNGGDLDLTTFSEVGSGSASDSAAHAAAVSAKSFRPGLSKAVSCSSGASASLSGSVGVSVTPALHAHFSLFGGLSSAEFSLTGSANASLTADVHASTGCDLNRTALLAHPLQIATFAGAVGPIPVVITLQGQLYVDANLAASADTTSNLTASASIAGGIKDANGKFSAFLTGPNASFTFNPPTITGNASASAYLEPAIQALLYGIAGPQLSLNTGLDFNADTTKNPWWSLDAPLSINASLTSPTLDLNSPDLLLYKHTFHIKDAGGPYGGPTTVSVISPGEQTGTVGKLLSLQIHASDSDGGALSYAATDLPAGLSINPTSGLIAGTPTTAGTSSVTVTATDATGPAGSTMFAFTINPTSGVGGGGGSPPPGGPWSASLESDGPPSVAPNGNVLTSDCHDFTNTGTLEWHLPDVEGQPANCFYNVTDSDGNSYVLTEVSSGNEQIESLSPSGTIRWATSTDGYVGWRTGPVLGDNGDVYFNVWNGAETKVLGLDDTTGAITLEQSFEDITGLHAYSGGLIVVNTDSEIVYLSYEGTFLHQYRTGTPISAYEAYSNTAGANGTVFVTGYNEGCGSTSHASVAKVTPAGVEWTWTDKAEYCNQTQLAATPDGGVIFARENGSAEYTKLSASGHQEWTIYPPSPLGHAESAGYLPVRVDVNGVVAIPNKITYRCAAQPTEECAGAQVEFVSQTTGASISAPIQVQSGTESSFIANSIALDTEQLYLTGQIDEAGQKPSITAFAVPGLGVDYQLSLQESLTGGG